MVNNFAVAVLQFAIPLYCLEHYGFNQVCSNVAPFDWNLGTAPHR
jgi:hypothetical protein